MTTETMEIATVSTNFTTFRQLDHYIREYGDAHAELAHAKAVCRYEHGHAWCNAIEEANKRLSAAIRTYYTQLLRIDPTMVTCACPYDANNNEVVHRLDCPYAKCPCPGEKHAFDCTATLCTCPWDRVSESTEHHDDCPHWQSVPRLEEVS